MPSPIVEEPDDDEKGMVVYDSSQDKEALESFDKAGPAESANNPPLHDALCRSLDVFSNLPAAVRQKDEFSLAVAFGSAMQSNGQDLLSAKSALNNSLESIERVVGFAPVNPKAEVKTRWDIIFAGSTGMNNMTMTVIDSTAEWFGLMQRLHVSLSYFQQSMASDPDNADNAVDKFRRVSKEFAAFAAQNSQQIAQIRNKTEDTMNQIMKTFHGGNQFQDAQNALGQKKAAWDKEQQTLFQLQMKKQGVLDRIRSEVAALRGALEELSLQEQYAKGDIGNLDEQLAISRKRRQALEAKAEQASNSRKELWCRRSGWFLWRKTTHYYKDVHTGDKSRLQANADRYKQMAQEAGSQLEGKRKMARAAAKDKKKTTDEINIKTSELECKRREHDKLIENQTVVALEAKKKYYATCKIIDDMVKKFAVGDTSMVRFLEATQKMRLGSLNMSAASKTMEVNIKTLSDTLSWQAETTLSIANYFSRDDVNLEALVEPLRQEGFVTIRDLKMKKSEFAAEVEPLCIAQGCKSNIVRKIKSFCCDKDVQKQLKKKGDALMKANVVTLQRQLPMLNMFLPSFRKRLKFAWTKSGHSQPQQVILQAKQLMDAEGQSMMEWMRSRESKAITDGKGRKAKKKRRKRRHKDTSSDESASDDSSSDDSSSDESSSGKRRERKKRKDRKKKKKDKKKRKRRSKRKDSSSDDESSPSTEEESSDSDDKRKAKKKRKSKKQKKTKRSKRRQHSSDDNDSSEEDSEPDRRKRKSKKKQKKRRDSKHSCTDEDDEKTDEAATASDNSSSSAKKRDTKKQKLEKHTMVLESLKDGSKVCCLDENYEKVKFKYDKSEWGRELKRLISKGKEKGVDVELRVSSIGDDRHSKYTITDAYLARKRKK